MTTATEDETIETPAPVAAAEETAPVAEETVTEPAAPAVEEPKAAPVKPKEVRIPLPGSLQEIVGALLFASQTPLTATDLRTCIRGVEPAEDEDAQVMEVYQHCTAREVEAAIRGLEKELERSGLGMRLVCAGGAYRLQTAPTCGRYVRALLKLDRPNRLSRASLETLAIIAYRQPITKTEIEQIRGVGVDTIVKTLVDLQLVRLVGRSELPGHPFLYGTTPLFLEHFGLASLSELNAIDPTLQRSNPRERAKLFAKKEPPKPEAGALPLDGTAAADAAAGAETAADDGKPAEPAAADGAEETAAAEEERPLVGARFDDEPEDDEELFIDDGEEELDDDDEEDEDGDEDDIVEDDDEDELDDDEDEDEFEDEDEDEEADDDDE